MDTTTMFHRFARRALIGALALGASTAWAYTPCDVLPGPQGGIPVDETTGVPTNTQLALWYVDSTPEESPIRLLETDTATEVPLSVTPVNDGGGLFLFRPAQTLKANTRYVIEWSRHPDEPQRFSSFETGAGTDSEAPNPTELTCVERGSTENEGGLFDWVAGHLSVAEAGLYHRIELSTDAAFSDVEVLTLSTFNDRAQVSTESCLDLQTHPHDVKFMRVTAIDSAGNEAEVSNEKKARKCATFGAESAGSETGTCNTLVVSTLGWMGFAVVPVLMLRRRPGTRLLNRRT